MNASMLRIAGPVLLIACLGACKPEPPPLEQPPEPKATATELRDAIQRPIDQAKAVENNVQEAADQQASKIDAVTQ